MIFNRNFGKSDKSSVRKSSKNNRKKVAVKCSDISEFNTVCEKSTHSDSSLLVDSSPKNISYSDIECNINVTNNMDNIDNANDSHLVNNPSTNVYNNNIDANDINNFNKNKYSNVKKINKDSGLNENILNNHTDSANNVDINKDKPNNTLISNSYIYKDSTDKKIIIKDGANETSSINIKMCTDVCSNIEQSDNTTETNKLFLSVKKTFQGNSNLFNKKCKGKIITNLLKNFQKAKILENSNSFFCENGNKNKIFAGFKKCQPMGSFNRNIFKTNLHLNDLCIVDKVDDQSVNSTFYTNRTNINTTTSTIKNINDSAATEDIIQNLNSNTYSDCKENIENYEKEHKFNYNTKYNSNCDDAKCYLPTNITNIVMMADNIERVKKTRKNTLFFLNELQSSFNETNDVLVKNLQYKSKLVGEKNSEKTMINKDKIKIKGKTAINNDKIKIKVKTVINNDNVKIKVSDKEKKENNLDVFDFTKSTSESKSIGNSFLDCRYNNTIHGKEDSLDTYYKERYIDDSITFIHNPCYESSVDSSGRNYSNRSSLDFGSKDCNFKNGGNKAFFLGEKDYAVSYRNFIPRCSLTNILKECCDDTSIKNISNINTRCNSNPGSNNTMFNSSIGKNNINNRSQSIISNILHNITICNGSNNVNISDFKNNITNNNTNTETSIRKMHSFTPPTNTTSTTAINPELSFAPFSPSFISKNGTDCSDLCSETDFEKKRPLSTRTEEAIFVLQKLMGTQSPMQNGKKQRKKDIHYTSHTQVDCGADLFIDNGCSSLKSAEVEFLSINDVNAIKHENTNKEHVPISKKVFKENGNGITDNANENSFNTEAMHLSKTEKIEDFKGNNKGFCYINKDSRVNRKQIINEKILEGIRRNSGINEYIVSANSNEISGTDCKYLYKESSSTNNKCASNNIINLKDDSMYINESTTAVGCKGSLTNVLHRNMKNTSNNSYILKDSKYYNQNKFHNDHKLSNDKRFLCSDIGIECSEQRKNNNHNYNYRKNINNDNCKSILNSNSIHNREEYNRSNDDSNNINNSVSIDENDIFNNTSRNNDDNLGKSKKINTDNDYLNNDFYSIESPPKMYNNVNHHDSTLDKTTLRYSDSQDAMVNQQENKSQLPVIKYITSAELSEAQSINQSYIDNKGVPEDNIDDVDIIDLLSDSDDIDSIYHEKECKLKSKRKDKICFKDNSISLSSQNTAKQSMDNFSCQENLVELNSGSNKGNHSINFISSRTTKEYDDSTDESDCNYSYDINGVLLHKDNSKAYYKYNKIPVTIDNNQNNDQNNINSTNDNQINNSNDINNKYGTNLNNCNQIEDSKNLSIKHSGIQKIILKELNKEYSNMNTGTKCVESDTVSNLKHKNDHGDNILLIHSSPHKKIENNHIRSINGTVYRNNSRLKSALWKRKPHEFNIIQSQNLDGNKYVYKHILDFNKCMDCNKNNCTVFGLCNASENSFNSSYVNKSDTKCIIKDDNINDCLFLSKNGNCVLENTYHGNNTRENLKEIINPSMSNLSVEKYISNHYCCDKTINPKIKDIDILSKGINECETAHSIKNSDNFDSSRKNQNTPVCSQFISEESTKNYDINDINCCQYNTKNKQSQISSRNYHKNNTTINHEIINLKENESTASINSNLENLDDVKKFYNVSNNFREFATVRKNQKNFYYELEDFPVYQKNRKNTLISSLKRYYNINNINNNCPYNMNNMTSHESKIAATFSKEVSTDVPGYDQYTFSVNKINKSVAASPFKNTSALSEKTKDDIFNYNSEQYISRKQACPNYLSTSKLMYYYDKLHNNRPKHYEDYQRYSCNLDIESENPAIIHNNSEKIINKARDHFSNSSDNIQLNQITCPSNSSFAISAMRTAEGEAKNNIYAENLNVKLKTRRNTINDHESYNKNNQKNYSVATSDVIFEKINNSPNTLTHINTKNDAQGNINFSLNSEIEYFQENNPNYHNLKGKHVYNKCKAQPNEYKRHYSTQNFNQHYIYNDLHSPDSSKFQKFNENKYHRNSVHLPNNLYKFTKNSCNNFHYNNFSNNNNDIDLLNKKYSYKKDKNLLYSKYTGNNNNNFCEDKYLRKSNCALSEYNLLHNSLLYKNNTRNTHQRNSPFLRVNNINCDYDNDIIIPTIKQSYNTSHHRYSIPPNTLYGSQHTTKDINTQEYFSFGTECDISKANEKRKLKADQDRPYKCTLEGCRKSYTSAYGLKYHLEKGHLNDDAPRPYVCTIEGCDKKYKNSNGLKYHLQFGHPENL
ncbi:hypothetical protein EDEG_00594 [Edhazardia aedis USNM 41457]|uniref:C2H2-type domain-containing protein n=1 Tax=Edhazardia aedis (strain USNM 41457) TaxID=1003232 RepID=J9A0C7_EDHAE|nr:hypothetical protein EDEG_00594 [Edhazardia aedis USNM 41457]|eukprot:EJW05368.1 hypothetical protein EDEG_00594 [Edhazardia aedis USNM 41457]